MCKKGTQQKEINPTEGMEVKVRRYELEPLEQVSTMCKVLNISDRQLRRMCERGEVAAVKVASTWRINSAEALRQYGLLA